MDLATVDACAFDDLLAGDRPLLDVRAPAEFAAGALPAATNLPLLEDEERRLVVSDRWQEEGIGTMPPLAAYAGTVLPEPVDSTWRVHDEHLAWHRANVFDS